MNEKYSELIKDIATMIADQDRENYLLKMELENVKAQLEHCEKRRELAENALEDYVARDAIKCAEGKCNA